MPSWNSTPSRSRKRQTEPSRISQRLREAGRERHLPVVADERLEDVHRDRVGDELELLVRVERLDVGRPDDVELAAAAPLPEQPRIGDSSDKNQPDQSRARPPHPAMLTRPGLSRDGRVAGIGRDARHRSPDDTRRDSTMPKKPTPDDLRNLLSPRTEPCISLFLPLPRHGPDLAMAPVRFRALVRQAEGLLGERYDARRVKELLAPLAGLARGRGRLRPRPGRARGVPGRGALRDLPALARAARESRRRRQLPRQAAPEVPPGPAPLLRPRARLPSRRPLRGIGARPRSAARSGPSRAGRGRLRGRRRAGGEARPRGGPRSAASGSGKAPAEGDGGRREELLRFFRAVEAALRRGPPRRRAAHRGGGRRPCCPLFREVCGHPALHAEFVEGAVDDVGAEELHARTLPDGQEGAGRPGRGPRRGVPRPARPGPRGRHPDARRGGGRARTGSAPPRRRRQAALRPRGPDDRRGDAPRRADRARRTTTSSTTSPRSSSPRGARSSSSTRRRMPDEAAAVATFRW